MDLPGGVFHSQAQRLIRRKAGFYPVKTACFSGSRRFFCSRKEFPHGLPFEIGGSNRLLWSGCKELGLPDHRITSFDKPVAVTIRAPGNMNSDNRFTTGTDFVPLGHCDNFHRAFHPGLQRQNRTARGTWTERQSHSGWRVARFAGGQNQTRPQIETSRPR